MRRLLFILLGLLFAGALRGQIYFYESFEDVPLGDIPFGWTMKPGEYYAYIGEPNPHWQVKESGVRRNNVPLTTTGEYYFSGYNLGSGKFIAAQERTFSFSYTEDTLITPIINVPVTDTAVHLSFLVGSESSHSQLLLFVYNGIYWHPIYQTSGITPPQKVDINITPYLNPSLQFAFVFRVKETAHHYVGIDEVTVYRKRHSDIVPVKTYLNTNSVCPFSTSEAVFLNLQNSGSQTAHNIRLKARVYKNGSPHGSIVSGYLDSLQAGQDTSYKFPGSFDLSLPGEYHIHTWMETDSGADYHASTPGCVSRKYALYEVTPGNSYEENFDSTDFYIKERWEFSPEIEVNYAVSYPFYTPYSDSFGWSQFYGRYEYYTGVGVTQDYSFAQIAPTGSDRRGGYMATIANYTANYTPGGYTTTLTSPCVILNPPADIYQAPLMFTYFLDANGNGIDWFTSSLWNDSTQQWEIFDSLYGTGYSLNIPWSVHNFMLDSAYFGKVTKIKFTAHSISSQNSVASLDKVSLGVPRDVRLKLLYIGQGGCPSGQDSIVVVMRNTGNVPLILSPYYPLTYSLEVQGPNGTQTYQGTVTQTLPQKFDIFMNSPTERYWIEPGDGFFFYTQPVYNFSSPGTYTYKLVISHYQDLDPKNDTLEGILIVDESVLPRKIYDFTGYTGNNLSSLYPEWREGKDNPTFQFGDASVYPRLIQDAQQFSPNIVAMPWQYDATSPNGTSVVFQHNTYQTYTDWLVSKPIKIPAFLDSLLLTYDISMWDKNNTGFSGMGQQHTFRMMIARNCGLLFDIDTTLYGDNIFVYLPVITYDSASVNGTLLQDSLEKGKTDTINLTPYIGEEISLAFASYDPGDLYLPQKRYDIFIDNIRFIIPPFDFAATNTFTDKDSVCINEPVSVYVTVANTGNQKGYPEGKIFYNNTVDSFQISSLLLPGDSTVVMLTNVSFPNPGRHQYTIVLTHPYDTTLQNDTIKGAVFVKEFPFILNGTTDTITGKNPQICFSIPDGACDKVVWILYHPLYEVSGGGLQDSFICVSAVATGTDGQATLTAIRYCEGCQYQVSKTIWVDKTVNISPANKPNVKVYPNPVTDELRVEVPSRAEIALYSLQGRELYVGKCRKTSVIDMSDFSRGMYFLQVETSEGISRFKVIKE